MRTQMENLRETLQKKILKLTKPDRRCEKNFYSLDDFKQRLAIEKRRSERVGYKSSIIFFSVKSLLDQDGKYNKLCIEDITKLICINIRATDVVCLFKKQNILILLPDTDNNGAQSACNRLFIRIMEQYSSSHKLAHDDFHIKILSFPEKQIAATALNDISMANRMSNVSEISPAIQISNELTFKREYHENLNLCMSTFNGSMISMPIVETFFWDQQLVSKFLSFGKAIMKRIMDIVGAFIGIILFLPIMLIIALMVKITSAGPIFYKQRRLGHKGDCFTFIKFRSMTVNNEDCIHQNYVKKLIHGKKDQINNGTDEKPLYKIIDDPRITAFGKFLRKTSLDELPQFFNVLKGEMSLVGPRPPIPYEVKEYQNWHFRRILEVKPGMTGLWQVSSRSRTTFDEMVRLDIQYAENWSLMMDLKILLKTAKAVFAAEGT